MTTNDHRRAGWARPLVAAGQRGGRSPMDRILALILEAGRPQPQRPTDRDHGLGTCRWCLNVVTPRSTGWVHLATGHPACLDPPMGAPLTCTAQPLPPAPHRWNVLMPTDTSRARIAWTLGIITDTVTTEPCLTGPDRHRRGDGATGTYTPVGQGPSERRLPPQPPRHPSSRPEIDRSGTPHDEQNPHQPSLTQL